MTTPLRSSLRLLGGLAALVALNASLTFVNVWPTLRIRWGNILSVELAVAVLLLAAAGRWQTMLARRVLPVAWVFLVAGRYAAVTGPGLYGREFNLYWDGPHLGNVAAMLTRVAPWWQIGLVAVVAVGVVAGAFILARVAFGRVGAALASPSRRLVAGALAGVVVVAFGAQPPDEHEESTGMVPFALPVTSAYVRQVRAVVETAGVKRALGATPPALATSLQRFGADVLLVFVESYGAVTYERPELASVVTPARDGLAGAARDARREVLSAFVDSPTFGASSWLAHLTLLTGVEVTDQYAYAALMAEPRDTLARSFKRSGYRSVAVMPGMRQAWPEGGFYGFDRIYGEDDLRYLGPAFGWWGIPDQFAMARFDDVELDSPRTRPVFAVFPTSTTHAPFGPVAPYLPDWSRVLRPDAFESEEAKRAIDNPPDLMNLRPSYAQAMAYEFEVFAGYVRQHAGDDQVLILIGDHQPPAAVSGPGASHVVPVHVVTSRPEIVEVLLARGFVRGVTPRQPPIGRMHQLVPIFFEAFGGSPGGRAPARHAN